MQRGHDWDRIAGASARVKEFLRAGMEVAMEEKAEEYKTILGGG